MDMFEWRRIKILFLGWLPTFFFVCAVVAAPYEKKRVPFDDILEGGKVIGSVSFGLKDTSLTKEAERELGRIARIFSALAGPFIVRVEGYADSSLEKKIGIQLSMQRAQTVKLYLSAKFPDLNVEFYMTGFGETRSLIPKEGEPVEVVRARERRVDLVVYAGATFFVEETKKASIPPVEAKPVVVEKALPKPVLPGTSEIIVSARSFKRYILSPDFFDDADRLRNEARPVVKQIMDEVREDRRWIFVSAFEGKKNGDYRNGRALLKQVSLACEIVGIHKIDPERLFLRGTHAVGLSGMEEGESGEVFIYIPMN